MRTNLHGEAVRTVRSLVSACGDYLLLKTRFASFFHKKSGFAFLVHPRSAEFVHGDVYGANDIFRPYPAFAWLFKILPAKAAERFVLWYARWVVPITLSRIEVRIPRDNRVIYGHLLSTVRTPEMLLTGGADTKAHLQDLFRLAARKKVARVGLGALLPSMTGYGKRLVNGYKPPERPAISTGHAYTAYVIAEYIRLLTRKRNAGWAAVRVAIVGAAGSTGTATLRTLSRTWSGPVQLQLILIDIETKRGRLVQLAREARERRVFTGVETATDLSAIYGCDYVVVVTNATGSIIRPDHVMPGTVILDDAQPRNTSEELVKHGCYVIDVLASVPGLEVNFDFGFRTADRSVTFTCLAETVIAAAVGEKEDLALGEVTSETVERMIEMVRKGKQLGLVGELPFFSFGRELSENERAEILRPRHFPIAPAAE